MKLPADIDRITLARVFESGGAYPPLGFLPFAERQLGNGDTFGLYWPVGREQEEPIVAEVWHDEWRLVPAYSTLSAFLEATHALDEDDFPEPPHLTMDPRSPLACLEAAKTEVQAQRITAAISHLETAVAVLPEYTDALSLLAAQYIRLGRFDEACRVALQAVISPPCFGQRPLKALRWLGSRQETPPPVTDDPIWRIRGQLRLVFGGEKENGDYPLLQEAIEQYGARDQVVKALVLMQTYGQLMSGETVSFQERYHFQKAAFRAAETDLSQRLPGGPRSRIV